MNTVSYICCGEFLLGFQETFQRTTDEAFSCLLAILLLFILSVTADAIRHTYIHGGGKEWDGGGQGTGLVGFIVFVFLPWDNPFLSFLAVNGV